MFPTKSLLATTLLALAVSASPLVVIRDSLITLPLTRKLNVTNINNLVRHDVSRARALKARGQTTTTNAVQLENAASVISESIDNQAVTYVASIGVGSPPTQYSLLIDTGSSNTWVGAGISYVKTSTSVETSNSVSVSYGSGSFSGTEYTDTVTIASGLVITGQSIGVASSASGFDGVDGILGIGPVDLTQGTLSPDTSSTIPTVTENLYNQGTISAYQIGISFEPPTSDNEYNGELTWGGSDSSRYSGSISYAPLTTTSPASYYWGINQSIRYGESTTILSTTAGIVDTGTTLLILASNAYDSYVSATGATLDSTTGLLTITSAQYSNLQSLYHTINGVTYEFTPNAQIWPRSLNSYIGGTTGNIYLVVANLGTPSGEGFDFINGYAWLERFYTVFDSTNQRIGFTTTPYTTATTN